MTLILKVNMTKIVPKMLEELESKKTVKKSVKKTNEELSSPKTVKKTSRKKDSEKNEKPKGTKKTTKKVTEETNTSKTVRKTSRKKNDEKNEKPKIRKLAKKPKEEILEQLENKEKNNLDSEFLPQPTNEEFLQKESKNNKVVKIAAAVILSIILVIVSFTFYPSQKQTEQNHHLTQKTENALLSLSKINPKIEMISIKEPEVLEIEKSKKTENVLNFKEKLRYQEAKDYCTNLNKRIPKIRELKYFIKKDNFKDYSFNRVWSSSKNKKSNLYIYDLEKKIDLVEDRKNMKYGVICFD